MRRHTDWLFLLLFAAAWLIWVAAVGVPIGVALSAILADLDAVNSRLTDSLIWSWGEMPAQVLVTFGWSGMIVLGAVVLGVGAGLALGRAATRGGTLLTGLLIAALCLPSYLIYWVWGLMRLPGSPLAEWARGHAWRADLLSVWQLGWGLALWTWPIVALCTAAAVRGIPAERHDMLTLDGAGPLRRTFMFIREARGGVILGAGLAFLSTLTSFAAFDLASVALPIADNYGSVLRRLRFEIGAEAALVAAAPMLALSVIAALLVMWALGRGSGFGVRGSGFSIFANPKPRTPNPDSPLAPMPATRGGQVGVALLLIVSLGVPVALMLRHLGGMEPFRRIGPLEGQAVIETTMWAAIAGLIFALITLVMAAGWSHERPLLRRLTTIMAGGWVIMGLLPAAALGSMLIVARSRIGAATGFDVPEVLWLPRIGTTWYGIAPVVILGYLGTYGLIAALIARWIAVSEEPTIADLRRTDGAVTLLSWMKARGPGPILACFAAGGIGTALSLGEVSTTMIVLPPGPQGLTVRLLNKMHYAREDSAIATCLVLMALVVPVALLCTWMLMRARGRGSGVGEMQSKPRHSSAGDLPPHHLISSPPRAMLLVLLVALLPLPGCDGPIIDETGALRTQLVIGSLGRAPGQFWYPRSIAFDPGGEMLYVVDKTGRIQRFDTDGRHIDAIVLPKFDRGFPNGLSVNPADGRLYVADTHENRVLVYTREGRLERIISEEGDGPGQMRYPTDVAFGPSRSMGFQPVRSGSDPSHGQDAHAPVPQGIIYVAEYGGNDRIQAFDTEGNYLFHFGEFGYGDGQFNRPQAIEYDAARDELVILDACNHRIVITDPRGNWKKTIGRPGRGPGELNYPYGLVIQDDGTFLVCEFGSNRIQHLDREGRSLGVFGIFGREVGQLQYPWGIAASGRRLYIVDSGNNRVQVVVRP